MIPFYAKKRLYLLSPIKKYTYKPHKFLPITQTFLWSIFILKIIFKSINSHNNVLGVCEVIFMRIFLQLLIKAISTKQKYIINAHIPKIIIKKNYFFSSKSIRMSGNSINLDDKKIKISDFYKNKNKKIFNIDGVDVNKILVSKKVSYGKNNSFK